MPIQDLLAVPDGVRKAASLIAGLDRCFVVGFGRLGPEQTQALQALGRVCAGTPLNGPVGAAVEALGRNEFVERHFAAVAAARAALQGAQYDALRKQAAEALGRPAADGAAEADGEAAAPEPVKVWQESTRHWLMEIAIAGFGQVDAQALAPFSATLEQLQAEPLTTRLAALLTGFRQELLTAMPVAALPSVPVFRWADLWTRAMLAALRPPPATAGEKVSATLAPLGIDLRHHGYFVSAVVYALAEGAAPRVVRVTLSSYKVDVVGGAEIWQCFDGPAAALLKAVANQQALAAEDATLLPTGDLLLGDRAKAKGSRPLLETAKKSLGAGAATPTPGVAAPDRHPVQLAEPVYLEGYTADKAGETLDLGGASLRVATERISSASELRPEDVAGSSALLGLLRFDGGAWAVQPLAVARGKETQFTGSGAGGPPKLGKKQKPTLAVLRERASRLLRKKG
jgi:hypothetical protein